MMRKTKRLVSMIILVDGMQGKHMVTDMVLVLKCVLIEMVIMKEQL